ncbi:MAG: RidA family protein [Planctomycetes bacterium]|nr:RidA family protein [Planctomycetota bacterium]
MRREAVHTDQAPPAIGPYSQAIKVDGWVWCSGQIPYDVEASAMVRGGAVEQTERVLRNLKAVLEAAGCTLDDVVRTTVYLADLGDFEAMNAVYARYFTGTPPARACIQAARLPRDALVEMDCVARL